MSTYGVRTRFIELLSASGGVVTEAAWRSLSDYASERGYTPGELRALLRPADYLELSRSLRSRGVRLADIKLDAGAWAAAEALGQRFAIEPRFDRLPNARPVALAAPAVVAAPAVGGTPLGSFADWTLTTTGATITFATQAADQLLPAVIFDLPVWIDPAPHAEPMGAAKAALAAATTIAEVRAAVEAGVLASTAYLTATDVPDAPTALGKNRRWGLQDLRRHAWFDAAAAVVTKVPAATRAQINAVLLAAKEKLLCDREYDMEVGSHDNYWPYWRNYRGALEKSLAQTAPGTEGFWQIKNRLDEIWNRKTVTTFRREVDEKDVERSTGMALVQLRPYSDDHGHRVSLAKPSFPTAPRYEVLHLADGTKVFRDGDALFVDEPARREVAASATAELKARAITIEELSLRPLEPGEPARAGIPYDWNHDGAIDLAPIDIGWWGHCHHESPLNALGIDPKRGVDLYRADPAVPAAQRLQHFTAEDIWDVAGALASDHDSGYATRTQYRMRETQVETTKFVGSRNDGGHWITLELARSESRRVRVDAEVTELWHKSEPDQRYPDPAARFQRDLPDGEGAFAPNPDWLASDSGDDDEIPVDGLGRRVTLRTTFVTFDASGERYQVKETVKLDPTADTFVKLADEILSANPSSGGKVAEHWYNAKRGAYYQVLSEVKPGGGRTELSRGQPATVRSVELRQETVYDSVIDLHDFVTKNMGLPFVFDTSSGLAVWNYPVDKVRIDRGKDVTRVEDGAAFTYTSYRLRYHTMGGPAGDAKYIIKRDAAGNPVRATAEDPMPDFAFRNEHWVCAPATTDVHGTPAVNLSALQGGYLLDKAGDKIVPHLWQRLATLLYASLSAPPGSTPVRLLEAADGTLSTFTDADAWKAATSS